MSYPVNRCPWCGQVIDIPIIPTVDTAIEKEREIWRPWDHTEPNTWTDMNDSGSTDVYEPPTPYQIEVY